MTTLRRKLLRDIVRMRATVLSIVLAVACAVAAFITLRGTYTSIADEQTAFYAEQRFADVFSDLKRAPLTLARELESIPGVARVYPRVQGLARVPLPGTGAPVLAQVISIPDSGRPTLNGLHLTAGRMPGFARDDEALLSESFARANGLAPGEPLKVVIEGREKTLQVVGLAMSPEFILAIPPGETGHAPQRYAVIWLPRAAVQAAYGLHGAFNNVLLDLTPQADQEQVVRALDGALARYGWAGAHTRDGQVSHHAVSQVLEQLATFALVAPLAFLLVAAFLLHVALSRFVELERQQIATLKALGFGNLAIGQHYLESAVCIVLLGVGPGVAAGAWLGGKMTAQYAAVYCLPKLDFALDLRLVGLAAGACAISGAVGALGSVRRAVQLEPAEAMRPPAPPSYVHGGLSRRLSDQLGGIGRMVLRGIVKRPSAILLSTMGIGMATSVIVVGQHFADKTRYLTDVYMQAQRRETLSVRLMRPIRREALTSLLSFPGVRDMQWRTLLPVRVRAMHRERVVPILSYPRRSSLHPLFDAQGAEIRLRPGSVVITDTLAHALHVHPGSALSIEPLLGDRSPRTLRLSATVPELAGLFVHILEDDLGLLLGSAPPAMQAALTVDSDFVESVQERLLRLPAVLTSTRKARVIAEARTQQQEGVGRFAVVLTLFAMAIAGAVVYNDARIALFARQRELSTLRVLGFTTGEVAGVLAAELTVQIALALPLGLMLGAAAVHGISASMDHELFRFPTSISGRTLAISVLSIISSAAISMLFVRSQVNKLDLVEALKSRE